MIKNSPGCTRDFRLAMWGTSSPGEKLASDLGSPIEATPIEGRRSNRLVAGKSPPPNFGLLQQYRHKREVRGESAFVPLVGVKRTSAAISYVGWHRPKPPAFTPHGHRPP